MDFRTQTPADARKLVELFFSAFSASEGEAEGALIARLAEDLLEKTTEVDRWCFLASRASEVVGGVFFSRMVFGDNREVRLMAPVAVHPDYQGRKVGQRLIRFALRELEADAVRTVLTYGDPAFYGKVGFQPISPEAVKPPFPLSQPEGWLGCSLSGGPLEKLSGRGLCVEALRHPAYW